MGHRLVNAAYAFIEQHNTDALAAGQRRLEPLEVSLLIRMAHTARDEDEHPVFFELRAKTCAALGLGNSEPARKRVQRAARALIDAGAVLPPAKVSRGFSPRYRLIYQGGAPASTFYPQAQTKGDTSAPLSGPEGGHQRTEVWTPEFPSMDASAPPEQEEQKEQEGNAREADWTLTEPPTPEPPPWDHNLPIPMTSQEAARCPKHPYGTPSSCFQCGQNRKTWQADQARSQPAKPPALTFVTIGGRRICDNQPHVLVAGGSCAHCEIRVDDLTAAQGVTA